jgi:hypothetical protein
MADLFENITHNPLAKSFTKYGFTFTQIKREGDVAIYRQTKGNFEAFEVIIIDRHNGYKLGDAEIPPAETYPSSSQWGSHGWTLRTLDRAHEKFAEVAAREQSK